MAVNCDEPQIVELLLEHCPSLINTLTKDKFCQSALHLAVLSQLSRICKILFKSSLLLIDIQDSDGQTALNYAVMQDNESLVQAILEKKPSISLVNKEGKTAIELANKSILELIQPQPELVLDSDEEERLADLKLKQKLDDILKQNIEVIDDYGEEVQIGNLSSNEEDIEEQKT